MAPNRVHKFSDFSDAFQDSGEPSTSPLAYRELEPRIAFDAAMAATGAEGVADDGAAGEAAAQASQSEKMPPADTSNALLADALSSYSEAPNATSEIVFIDTNVDDIDTLIASIDPNFEIILLDAGRDGVEQIAEILADRSNLDAIHIISHGDQGILNLGTASLTLESMNNEYIDELLVIGDALSENADLLIYGCNFGEGELGALATNLLAQLTGADVAASIDPTGHADLGGDWDLELTQGTIEADVVISDEGQEEWQNLLANTAPTFDVGDGISTTPIGSGNSYARDVVMQSDGKMVTVGYTGTAVIVTRHNSDGTIDTSFGGGDGIVTSDEFGLNGSASAVTLQSDGKILVAGSSGNDFLLLRYNTDGTIDTSFGGGDGIVTTDFSGNLDEAFDIIVQPDGRIILAGRMGNGGGTDFAVVRYLSDGSLDTSFDGDGMVSIDTGTLDEVTALTLDSNNRIVLVGSTDTYYTVIRLNVDGTMDTSFDGDGSAFVIEWVGDSGNFLKGSPQSVTVQSDDKIVLTGYVNDDIKLVRLNTNGGRDTSFSGTGVATIPMSGTSVPTSVEVLSNGDVLVGGYSDNGSDYDFIIARYTSAGVLDTSFGGGDGIVITDVSGDTDKAYGMFVQPDGKIVLAGDVDIAGTSAFGLVRYNSDGTLDTRFDLKTALGDTVAFTEGGAAVVLDNDVILGDVELDALNSSNGNYDDTSLTLTRNGGASSEDIFSFNDGNGITLSGSNLIKSGQIIASFDTTSVSGQLVITFTDANGQTPTTANVNDILRQITYSNSNILPPVSVQIDWEFNDGNSGSQGTGGAKTDTGSTTINITAVNDAPAGLPTITGTVAVDDTLTADTSGISDPNGLGTFSYQWLRDGSAISGATASTYTVTEADIGTLISVQVSYTDGDGTPEGPLTSPQTIAVPNYNEAPTFDVGDGIVITEIGTGNSLGHDTVVQNDGKIITVGSEIDGIALTRHNSDGALDASFGGGDGIVTYAEHGIDGDVYAVALQSDGKILVAGMGNNDFLLIRYNINGTVDTGFGGGDGFITTKFTNNADRAQDIIVQPDGRIIVAGYIINGTNYDFAVARYLSDGSLDTSFGGDGKVSLNIDGTDAAYAVSLQSDGKIVVAGRSETDIAIARFNTNGSLDTSFSGDGIVTTNIAVNEYAFGLEIQSDGKILAVGSANGVFRLIRYNTDGSLDTSFSGDGIVTTAIGSSNLGMDVKVQPDGKILAAGRVLDGNYDFTLFRYNSDGSLDTSFGGGDGIVITDITGGYDRAQSMSLQSDGKIILVGDITENGIRYFCLVRYNSDGTLDTSFGAVTTLGDTVAFTEGGAAVILDNDVVLSDDELDALNSSNGNYDGTSLTLARNGGASSEDVFSFNDGNGITLSGSNLIKSGQIIASFDTTSVSGQLLITFTDANGETPTTTDINDILRQIAYSNSNILPPSSVQIDWTFNDGNSGSQGTGGAKTDTGSTTINITDLSSPAQTLPSAQTIDEDGTLSFSTGNGNAITVSDESAGNSMLQVTLTATNGTLTLSQTTGLSIPGGSNGSSYMVVQGLESDINAALEGMNFTPASDYSGAANISVTTTLAAQLEGYYSFDAGTAVDDSIGVSQNGTLVGNATIVTDGTRGEVLSLDGNRDYVQITGLFGEPENVTLAAWVNLTSPDTGGTEVITLGQNLLIRVDDPLEGLVAAYYDGTTWVRLDTGIFIAGTGWRHVAVVFDDTNDSYALYLDGTLVQSISTSDSINYGQDTDTFIGAHSAGNSSFDFNGLIDDTRIYTRALSAGEISALASDQPDATGDISITVDPINDTPVFSNLNGGTAAFTEGGASVVLDNNVTISDTELDALNSANGNYDGTSLTLTRNGGASSDDVFTFNDGNGITLSGSNLIKNGQVIASFDTTSVSGQLVITFTDANGETPTTANVNDILRQITYSNSNILPPSSVQIDWEFNDGNSGSQGTGGAKIDTGSTTITITAVNDAPIGLPAITGTVLVENTLTADTSGISDPNGLGTFSYQWLRDGIAIPGAIASTYTLAIADEGVLISVEVSYTDGDGKAEGPLTSTQTAAVPDYNAAPTFEVGDGIVRTEISTGNSASYDAVIQNDGKIVTVGSATGGIALTRHNSDGTLDTSFGGGDGIVTYAEHGIDGGAYSVVLQSDGKILVAGYSADDFLIIRYNTNGTVDTSFGGGTGFITTDFFGNSDYAFKVLVQPDGRIILTGVAADPSTIIAVARYLSDGSLDTSFGSGGKVTIDMVYNNNRAAALQSDGKIVITGYAGNFLAIARLNSDGTLDTNFDGDGILTTEMTAYTHVSIQGVVIQSDGKIVLGGYVDGKSLVLRYNSDGSLDTSFSGDGIQTIDIENDSLVLDIEVQTDGKIVFASRSNDGTSYNFAVTRLNSDGSLDTSFGSGGSVITDINGEMDIAKSIIIQSDGKIVLAGRSTIGGGGGTDLTLVRYNSDGTQDTKFDLQTTLGDTVAFTEGGAAVILDNDVILSDAELDALNSANGNYDGAGLTLARNGGASSEDVFTFNDGNGITLSSGNLIKNGQIIANFDTTSVSGQLVVTFTDANGETPTTADVNNILRQITYSNSNILPPSSVQIDWAFNDGNSGNQGTGGAKTDTGSTTINITAVNDAPIGLPTITGTIAIAETLTADTSGISDPNGLGTFSYQWLRDGSTISGATASTYTVTETDIGTLISVEVSYTDGDGTAEGPLTSAQTAAVPTINIAPTFDVGDGSTSTVVSSNASYGKDVVIQPDGKIITTGYTYDSGYKISITRHNSDGTLDTSFGGGDGIVLSSEFGQYGTAQAVTLQSDGKILVAGRNTSNNFLLMRYNTNGTIDTTFGGGDGIVTTDFPGSLEEAYDIIVQPNGRIILAGRMNNGVTYDIALARYYSNGSLDTSFSGDGMVSFTAAGSDSAHAVALQSDGKIVIAGSSNDGFTIARLNSNGSLDTSFSGDGIVTTNISTYDYAYGIDIQSDGKILVAGTSDNTFTLVRYNTNGSLDTSFSGDGIATTYVGTTNSGQDVRVQSNGKILISGSSHNGDTYDFTLIRYNSNGSLDTSFGGGDGIVVTDFNGGTDRVRGMSIQSDGKIILAGEIEVDGDRHLGLARYNYDGTLDTEFGPDNSLGGTVAFTEDAAAVVLDNDVTISDDELDALNSANGNYDGANITLTRNGGTSSEDVFTFNDSNGITLSGGNLIKSGQIIASFDTTTVSGQLVITFTDTNGQTPTTANVNNIMRQITYSNTNSTPPGSVQIDWVFSDGNTGDQGSGGAKTDSGSTTINITAVNDAPVGLPTISGTTAVSDTLTADTSGISDADGLGAFSFQWLRDGSSISGATALTYTLVGADVSTQISVQVSYTDANGQNEGPLISAQTAAITPANVAPVGLPAITGTITENQTLTADTSGISDGNGLGTFSYQWLRGGSSISGATTSTYTLGDTDVGTLISVQVSFTDGDGTNEGPLTSAQTAAIVNVNDAPVGLPTITGTVTEDQVLTADTSGISDIDGLGTFSYQWLRDGNAISGATTSTYTLGDADVGTLISVSVSYTDGEGTGEGPLTSTQTAAIVNVNDTPVGLPTITGTIAEDQTLTADTSGISDADGLGSFSYQWLRDGGAIAGADESTYTLEVSDIGGLISVQVSYTDGNGTSEGPLTSTQTTAVTATNDAPTFSAGTGIVLTSVDGGNSYTQDVILQTDGKIITAGYTSSTLVLTRHNVDGTLDTSFGGGDGIVSSDFFPSFEFGYAVTLQSDGKILVAGRVASDFLVVRYNTDGTVDTSFGGGDGIVTTDFNGGVDFAQDIIVQPDGRIIVAGRMNNGSNYDFAVVRYLSDGSLDTSFSGDGKMNLHINGSDSAEAIALQSDGKILIAGNTSNSSIGFSIVRLNSDGTLDTSFSGDGIANANISGGQDLVYGMTIQSDGKILLSGYATNKFALVRFNSDGSLDTSFSGDGKLTTTIQNTSVANDVKVQSDGKILVTGYSHNGSNYDFVLTRYNSDGSLDTSFGGGDGIVITNINGDKNQARSLSIQSDGKIIVAGEVRTNGTRDFGLVRYNTDGTLDTTFGPANTLNDTVSFIEDGAAVILDNDVTISDEELDALNSSNGNYDGSSLTLSRNGGASGEDVFSFNDGNGITLSGSNLIKSGQIIASFDITSVSGQLVITFTDANGETPTTANINNIMRQITYSNTNNSPPGSVQIDWEFNDGNSGSQGSGGAKTDTGNTTIDITETNDAAVGVPTITGTVTEDQTLTADISGITDADGLGTFLYQWLRDGSSISGATTSTYTLGDTDVGTLISVMVGYTDGNGTFEGPITSAQTAAVANVNDAPVGLPTISGTVTEDQVLTADTSGISDIDGLGAFSYQWLRDGNAISGATTSTYTLGDADVGTLISVSVSYTDGEGTGEGPLTSTQTAAVTNINDAPAGLPTITGTVTEDQVLTADTSGISDADGLGTFSYQWLRDGSAISGATGSTYTLGDTDVGTLISVRVSYTDGEGTNEGPLTSVQTAAVANINDAPVGLPTITGTVTENQTLTADTSGISDADGLGAFSYQWLRNGSTIAGATTSSYTLGDADVGTLISVSVNYTDGEGTSEGPITSLQTAAIANINDTPVGLPSIIGTPTEDQTLIADTSGITDADGLGTFSYQWLRNGSVLSGATASTYTLGDDDVGTLISLRVSYTDGEGTSEGPLTSAQTAAIANINDAPVITSNGGATSASSTMQEGNTFVTTIVSTDIDGGTPIYSISGGSEASLFSIDPTTGDLSFKAAPDFDTPKDIGGINQYRVIVQVSDSNGGTDTQTITIEVTSNNETTISLPDPDTPQDPKPEIDLGPDQVDPNEDILLPKGNPFEIDELLDIYQPKPESAPKDNSAEDEQQLENNEGKDSIENIPSEFWPETQVDQIIESAPKIEAVFNLNLQKIDRAALAMAMDKSLSDLQEKDHILGLTPMKLSLSMGSMLTAGFVSWALRGGTLLSALLTTMPTWKGFDPLIVLVSDRSKEEEEETDEDDLSKVETIFQNASKAHNNLRDQS